jgi:branched-chain amino acid transport system substrate-binding protein
MRHPTVIAVCAVAVASLGIAACSSSSSTSSSATTSGNSSSSSSSSSNKTPFVVLAIVASSGPLAAVTASEMQGMAEGAKYVNAHGGIDGHMVQVIVKNDNDDPTTAATLLQSYLSGGTAPDAVYAGTTSTETYAMEPILTQAKVLSLQTATSDQTMDPSKFPYAFSLASSSSDFGMELAHAVKAKYPNAKKIGLILGNDVTGDSNLHNELISLHQLGYTTSVEQYDPTNTVNMTPQLEALKATNPDVVVAGGFGAPAGYILKARAQIGWNVPLVGDASFSSNPLPAMANASELQSVSVLSTQNQVYVPLTQHSPAFQTLYNAVLPASGTFEVPFLLYAFGWDDIMVLQAAATQAGSFTTQAMTQALENLNNPTAPDFLLGPYHYSSTVHTAIADLSQAVLVSPYTKDGQSLPFGQTS